MSAIISTVPRVIQEVQGDSNESPQIPDPLAVLKQNAARTDEAVAVNRATNPGDALENARRIRRLSMAELNRRDSADLERMMDEIQYDPRGPVTKVLDVIDLPRNTIANIVAPGIAAKKRKAGDTGTFGMGKVTFSDYLEELGMRPGIARAVLGFAGDVLTDPLTYVGPGAITKLAGTTAGRASVQTLRSGVKAQQAARKVLASGGGIDAIGDVATRNLYKAFHGSVPADQLAAKAGELSESFLGKVAGKPPTTKAGKLADTAKGVLGFDVDRGGSVIADYARKPLAGAKPEEAAKIKAAQEWIAAHGKAAPGTGVRFDARRGLSIGDGGSQIAHVPFTNFGINVPAFTGPGMAALKAASVAQAKAGDPTPLVKSLEIENDLKAMGKLQEEWSRVPENLRSPSPFVSPSVGEQAKVIADRIRANAAALATSVSGRKLGVDDIRVLGEVADKSDAYARMIAAERGIDPLRKFIAESISKKTSRETLLKPETYAPIRDEAKASMDLAAAVGSTKPPAEVVGKLGEYLLNTPDADLPARLAEADAWLTHVEAAHDWAQAAKGSIYDVLNKPTDAVMESWAKDFLGLSDEAMGSAAFLPAYRVAQSLERDGYPAPFRWLETGGADTRAFFGNRGNYLNDIRRTAEAKASLGAEHEAVRFVEPHYEALRTLKDKYQLASEDNDKLLAALHGMWVERSNKGTGFYTEAWDNLKDAPAGTPSIFSQAIAEAGPIFARNPGLADDLGKIADGLVASNAALGEQAIGLGLLDGLRESQVPNVLTPEARKAVAQARRNPSSAAGASATGRPGEVLEAFQKARTSDQFRFQGRDGVWRRIFEWDFEKAALSKDAIDAIPPGPVRDEMLKAIADVDEFNAIYKNPSEQARRGMFRATDPMELNDLIKSGRLKGLTAGATLPDGGFITNPIVALVERSRQQFAAAARKAGREILNDGAIYANQSVVARRSEAAGEVLTFSNGVEARVIKNPGGQSYVRIGNEPYRQLNKVTADMLAAAHDNSPMSGLLDQKAMTAYYPAKKAEFIERMLAITENEESTIKFLRGVDQLTKIWKSTTLLHPSWTIGNLIGGAYLAAALGANLAKVAEFMPAAIKAIRNEMNPDAVSGVETVLRGGKTNLAQLLRDTDELGVRNVNRGSEYLRHLFPDGTTPGLLGIDNKLGAIKDRLARRTAYHYERLAAAKGAASPNFADKAQAWLNTGKDEAFFRRFMSQWAQANAKLEDSMRLAAYMALIDQGESAASAARKVVEGMFDMTDMTAGERATRKYLMPFYTWLRNSGAYGVHLMLQDPKKIAMVPRLKELVEESLNGEANVPEYMRPSWMREQMAVQLGKNPDTRYAFMVGSMIPTETATQFAAPLAAGAEGIGSLAKYALSSVNPIIQTGIALGTGREAYTGRTIGFKPYEGDIRWTDFLAGQIRPIREAVPMGLRGSPLGNAAEAGPGQLAARVLLGGRAQPFDDNRLAYGVARDIRDRAEQLRKYITLAEREGKADESLKARAELMAVYRDAVARGREDEVPAWARKMVQERTSSPSAAD